MRIWVILAILVSFHAEAGWLSFFRLPGRAPALRNADEMIKTLRELNNRNIDRIGRLQQERQGLQRGSPKDKELEKEVQFYRQETYRNDAKISRYLREFES